MVKKFASNIGRFSTGAGFLKHQRNITAQSTRHFQEHIDWFQTRCISQSTLDRSLAQRRFEKLPFERFTCLANNTGLEKRCMVSLMAILGLDGIHVRFQECRQIKSGLTIISAATRRKH